MQIPIQTLNSYKEKFKLANPRIRFYQEDKTWYRDKFQFKINFRRNREFWNSEQQFTVNRWYIKTFGPARFRTETYNTVFTNSTDFLDFVLKNQEALGDVVEFYTSSEQYVNEVQNIGNIAVDVRLVNPKTMAKIDAAYEVEFDEWKLYDSTYNGNYGDRRATALVEILNFCKTNKNDVAPYPHLAEWYKHHKKDSKDHTRLWGYSPYYYGRVSVYVKNEDIILQLVMMYQDKIKKIYKLVERVKK